MGDEHAPRVDRVRVSVDPDPRAVDHVADIAQVDRGDHHAAPGRPLGDGDVHVRPGTAQEVDATEISLR